MMYIYIYKPGTQITLVLNGVWAFFQTFKIGDIHRFQVINETFTKYATQARRHQLFPPDFFLGIYIYIHINVYTVYIYIWYRYTSTNNVVIWFHHRGPGHGISRFSTGRSSLCTSISTLLGFKKSAFVQVEVGVLIRKLLESPGSKVLLMDKIRLTTKDDESPIIYGVLTIPGGAGFLPSTVCGSSLLAQQKNRSDLWGLPCANMVIWGWTLKCWVSPTNPWGFPTRNDHLGVWNGGYHHLRKHPLISRFLRERFWQSFMEPFFS